jgi:arylsulfatase A-like enzyme
MPTPPNILVIMVDRLTGTLFPGGTDLAPRPDDMATWDSVPAEQRAFQTRLMEVFAGLSEHADVQAGRVVDEIARLGLADNTIIFYIHGDNGASAEGQTGTVSELLAQNNLASDISQHLAAVEARGGIAALGGVGGRRRWGPRVLHAGRGADL